MVRVLTHTCTQSHASANSRWPLANDSLARQVHGLEDGSDESAARLTIVQPIVLGRMPVSMVLRVIGHCGLGVVMCLVNRLVDSVETHAAERTCNECFAYTKGRRELWPSISMKGNKTGKSKR